MDILRGSIKNYILHWQTYGKKHWPAFILCEEEMKFSIIVPCYNEYSNIPSLVEKLRPLQNIYDLEYILVENGSKDDSKSYFEQNIDGKFQNVKVVYVPINQGYGYGLQQGLKACVGDYVGWIHADMQISPDSLTQFFDFLLSNKDNNNCYFFKGRRKNRSPFEVFFTSGQAIFDSILFKKKMYDITAIPVLFHNSLIDNFDVMPNDFSIEIYTYYIALQKKFVIKRFPVDMQKRRNGESSWNKGLLSRFRLAKKVISDSIKIKKGEKVL